HVRVRELRRRKNRSDSRTDELFRACAVLLPMGSTEHTDGTPMRIATPGSHQGPTADPSWSHRGRRDFRDQCKRRTAAKAFSGCLVFDAGRAITPTQAASREG